MTRQHFPVGPGHTARLLKIIERPIENRTDGHCLLRLEFEIFHRDDKKRVLSSIGSIASRDLIICSHSSVDEGVAPFIRAISVENPEDKNSWFRMASADATSIPWVTITFGPQLIDERNTFRKIVRFNAKGYHVRNWSANLTARWLTIPKAAEEWNISDSTLRRKLKKVLAQQPELTETMIRRRGGQGNTVQKGEQREVNLLVASHVLNDLGWLEQLRITEIRHRQEAEQENLRLTALLEMRDR